jgi:hypothetical protein
MPSKRLMTCALVLALCAFASAAPAQKQVEQQQPPTATPPEQAAQEGQALVAQILAQKPTQNTTNTGVMTIRSNGKRTQVPIQFEVFNTETYWCSQYHGGNMSVTVVHYNGQPNEYRLRSRDGKLVVLSGNQASIPFAGSDFSIADLGLEFFHWPGQHLIKKEMKRSRSCKVLESINPKPDPGSYSRVVSWIDNDSDGIVMAQAYDAQGQMVKDFIPQKFEKVNGQWQLERMEIDNRQTDSSTRVDFDLNK